MKFAMKLMKHSLLVFLCINSALLAATPRLREGKAKEKAKEQEVLAKLRSKIEAARATANAEEAFIAPIDIGIPTAIFSIQKERRSRIQIMKIAAHYGENPSIRNSASDRREGRVRDSEATRLISTTVEFFPVVEKNLSDLEKPTLKLLRQVGKYLRSQKLPYRPCYRLHTHNPQSTYAIDVPTAGICVSLKK